MITCPVCLGAIYNRNEISGYTGKICVCKRTETIDEAFERIFDIKLKERYDIEIMEEKMKNKDTNPKDAVGIRKAPMSTVPANVMAEVGVAMLEGAVKYGRHNYRVTGVRNSVYYDGTMRHLMAWWEGEDLDPDSGVSHITKAIASLVVLRDAMLNDMATDDRPPKPNKFYENLNQSASDVIDRYADKNPTHFTELNKDKKVEQK